MLAPFDNFVFGKTINHKEIRDLGHSLKKKMGYKA